MIEDQISIQHKLQIFLGKDSLSQEMLAKTKKKSLLIMSCLEMIRNQIRIFGQPYICIKYVCRVSVENISPIISCNSASFINIKVRNEKITKTH